MLYKVTDRANIDLADNLIKAFSQDYITLYGEKSQTFTFHCLSNHLVSNVRLHGSFCSYSMFSIEGTLGRLKSSLNGTRGHITQYITSN